MLASPRRHLRRLSNMITSRLESSGARGKRSILLSGTAFPRKTSTRHGTIPNGETWLRRFTTSMVRTTSASGAPDLEKS